MPGPIPASSLAVPDRVKGAVFLPVGIGLLIAAAFAVGGTRDFLARSRTAPGVVAAEEYGPHHVEVRFRTREGRIVRYHQNGMVTLHTGQRIVVRYDPREPTRDPCVDERAALWDGAVSLGLLGGVFTCIGAYLLRVRG